MQWIDFGWETYDPTEGAAIFSRNQLFFVTKGKNGEFREWNLDLVKTFQHGHDVTGRGKHRGVGFFFLILVDGIFGTQETSQFIPRFPHAVNPRTSAVIVSADK
jgi:hypothetical protein